MTVDHSKDALILIDHGSRLEGANRLLERFRTSLSGRGSYLTVAIAHMELAQPDLGAAFEECARAGAQRVVIVPYFLATGRHVTQDIPRIASEAAARHPRIAWRIAEPLGFDERLVELIVERGEEAARDAGRGKDSAPSGSGPIGRVSESAKPTPRKESNT